MASLKQHREYFHFRCSIQLDLPVHGLWQRGEVVVNVAVARRLLRLGGDGVAQRHRVLLHRGGLHRPERNGEQSPLIEINRMDRMSIQSGASGCEKGFVKCFLKVPIAYLARFGHLADVFIFGSNQFQFL